MNFRMIMSMVTDYGIDVIAAIAILIVGWIIAGWVRGALRRAFGKLPNFDDTLAGLLSNAARYVVIAVTVIAVLGKFGIETASLIAVFGTVGLAIGLAMQGTLSNVASGVMILLFRPFKLGDFITAGGHSGTVELLGLFVTELATVDNVKIIIPNNQIWGQAVMNYSAHDTRRLELGLGISYEDSIDQAMQGVAAVLSADGRILPDPAPLIAVSELADSSVNLVIRVWCNSGDLWDLKWDLTKALKERMDADGISIPYPQVTLHQATRD